MPKSSASAAYSVTDFWIEFGDFARAVRREGRDYFEYEEWHTIFKRAKDAGLCDAVTVEGEAELRFRRSPNAHSLQATYHAIREARRKGIPAREFAAQFSAQTDLERRAFQKRQDEWAAKRREDARGPRPPGKKRHDPVDDEGPFTVMVGR